MKINPSENSVYSAKQQKHEVQNRGVSKTTALKFFSDRLGNNSIAIPIRQKRDANQDKKAMCDHLKLGSLEETVGGFTPLHLAVSSNSTVNINI
ncbi:hypothetical protein [Rickettsiella massiliensis]|uniref:hypothetical protein n=1 Tax=Rickettsiella massiliensis TaxID=676517 RepID=UPI00029A2890|nr:hypothetical protein [Rickettsiella massiliensis]